MFHLTVCSINFQLRSCLVNFQPMGAFQCHFGHTTSWPLYPYDMGQSLVGISRVFLPYHSCTWGRNRPFKTSICLIAFIVPSTMCNLLVSWTEIAPQTINFCGILTSTQDNVAQNLPLSTSLHFAHDHPTLKKLIRLKRPPLTLKNTTEVMEES